MLYMNSLPIDITDHIRKFRDFLNACWPHLDSLMEDHDWDDDGKFSTDWLQANWEFLVERELLEKRGFLTPFSLFYSQNRMTYPEKTSTHSVIAKSTKNLFDLRDPKHMLPPAHTFRLFCFLTHKRNAFGLYPPFDLANLFDETTQKEVIVSFDDVRFYLDRYPSSMRFYDNK